MTSKYKKIIFLNIFFRLCFIKNIRKKLIKITFFRFPFNRGEENWGKYIIPKIIFFPFNFFMPEESLRMNLWKLGLFTWKRVWKSDSKNWRLPKRCTWRRVCTKVAMHTWGPGCCSVDDGGLNSSSNDIIYLNSICVLAVWSFRMRQKFLIFCSFIVLDIPRRGPQQRTHPIVHRDVSSIWFWW